MSGMRIAMVIVAVAGGAALGQSPGLPVTAPTASAPAAVSAAPLKNAGPARHTAEVIYSAGELTVLASNSSLNQILRDIAKQTGMKITGGVADERVYGNYGPGRPVEVLGRLLAGTGSNMLLKATAQDVPTELILTPKNGGVIPPSPSAMRQSADEEPMRATVPPAQVPPAQVPPAQVPPAQVPPPQAQPVQQPVYSVPAVAAQDPSPDGSGSAPGSTQVADPPASTEPAASSPNGVKTPQQIYEELQKLQQQQAKPQ
jgi:hypothetical protein